MKNNTPNPLVPQGTFPEQRSKSHVRIAVFTILAIHLVLLSALLMAGCKGSKPSEPLDNGLVTPPNLTDTNPIPPFQTSTPPPVVAISNPPPVVAISNPPVTPPNPVPAPAETEREHVIVKGDTFAIMAKKYNISVSSITALNPTLDPKKLKIGDKVKIPASSATKTGSGNGTSSLNPITTSEKVHVVKSKETLTSIAKAEGTTVKELRAYNGLKTDQLKVGAKLKIPAAKAKAIAPAAPTENTLTPTGTGIPSGIAPPVGSGTALP
jgi:N-acetylmuramoyl-L-alanine amidase